MEESRPVQLATVPAVTVSVNHKPGFSKNEREASQLLGSDTVEGGGKERKEWEKDKGSRNSGICGVQNSLHRTNV